MRFVVQRPALSLYHRQLCALLLVVCLALAASWQGLMATPDTTVRHKLLALPSSGDSQALGQLSCERPAAVREDLLEKWHCRLLRDSCLDQV